MSIFMFFIAVLGVLSGSMTFLDLLRSILHLEMPKRWPEVQFGPIFVFSGPFSDKSGPKIPNSFRKSRPHTASQAKVLCGK